MEKSFLQSRTLWANVLAIGAYIAKEYLGFTELPALDPAIIALVNIVLRFFTNKAVVLSSSVG